MATSLIDSRQRNVGWNQLLEARVEALRERVLGPVSQEHPFVVDGIFFDQGVKVVVHGDLTAETTPRLETVLEGLLMLNPSEVTVELDATTALQPDALKWIAQREDSVVHFLTCPVPS